jgi:hypothetical protein
VDDEADVGLVDAHAKGDGGADDADLVAEEGLLVARALLGIEAGVVGAGGDAAAGEGIGDLLGLFAAGAVDDAGVARTLFQEGEELLDRLVLGFDAGGEVRTVEGGDEDRRVA